MLAAAENNDRSGADWLTGVIRQSGESVRKDLAYATDAAEQV